MPQDNEIRIDAAQCPLCRDVLVSRWQHDLHGCSCGAIAIDGGQDYYRSLWTQPNRPIRVTVLVDSINEVRAGPGVWAVESTEPCWYRLVAGKLVPVEEEP